MQQMRHLRVHLTPQRYVFNIHQVVSGMLIQSGQALTRRAAIFRDANVPVLDRIKTVGISAIAPLQIDDYVLVFIEEPQAVMVGQGASTHTALVGNFPLTCYVVQ